MTKRLIISEKPSVAKDISSALGGFSDENEYFESDEYIVTWAVGHLLELVPPEDYDKKLKSWSLKNLPILPEEFQTKPKDGQKGRLNMIKKLGRRKDVDGVINACDAGREGEMIYRRIAEFAELNEKPCQRLWLQSMTADGIRKGFSQLRAGEELDSLADAAWCRAVGDWLIGMNATRALTQRLRSRGEPGAWTAGRVQTPTLNLLVRRELEILAHVPATYWEIKGQFKHDNQEWEATYWDRTKKGSADRNIKPDRIFDEKQYKNLLAELKNVKAGDARETRKPSKQSPPLLFDLTSLQREANRRFSFSAKRTLSAAQRLYEGHKLITYPRTDARYLPEDYTEQIGLVLQQLSQDVEYGNFADTVIDEGPKNLKRLLNNEKITDHFAIMPTDKEPQTVLTGDDARIYDLIVRQFIAALMGPAIWNQVERFVSVGLTSGSIDFRATSRTLDIPGFQAVLKKESANDDNKKQQLPYLVPGQTSVEGVSVAVLGHDSEEKLTKPRGRYTEAALLRMMETAGEYIDDEELVDVMRGKGLGTPATRADIIENLVRKGYARRSSSKLVPATKAIRLIDILDRVNVPALASPHLTGQWEQGLTDVQNGNLSREAMLQKLVSFTTEVVDALKGFEHDTLYDSQPSLGSCPNCEEGQIGESAWGYPCSENKGKESKCNFIIWKDRGGKFLDRNVATTLLVERKTAVLDGFFDRSGNEGRAALKLELDEEKGRWVVTSEFEGGSSVNVKDEEEIGKFGNCPVHENCDLVETTVRFVCRQLMSGEIKKGGCVLPKIVCHREMEEADVRNFFSEGGKTEILEGFISKRGRPFRGALFRKENGRHGFEFPPRAPRDKKASAKKKAPVKKKTTAKKTTAKKTAAKKTTAKKTTAKKTAAKKTTAKKTTAKKTTAKKTTAKKTTAKKTTAKKTTAKKT